MELAKHREDPSARPRKVLLAASDASIRAIVPTFLITMGWQCAVVANTEAALPLIEREIFDAVLLDLGGSAPREEEGILKIKEIRPSLSDRLLVISSGRCDAETKELIERHDMLHLSQEVMVQQLWPALQELISRPGSRNPAPQVARMIFDSFRSPVMSGVRSSRPSARQLAFEYKSAMIDLSIQSPQGSGRILLAGQILDSADKKGKSGSIPVILTSGPMIMARTTTNQFGEFNLEFDFLESAGLEIRLGEKSWVAVPLGRMNWVKRMPGAPTGSL